MYLIKDYLIFRLIYCYPVIDMMVSVLTSGPGDQASILGRVVPKTEKMVLDASFLNTQHYKEQLCLGGIKAFNQKNRLDVFINNLVSNPKSSYWASLVKHSSQIKS